MKKFIFIFSISLISNFIFAQTAQEWLDKVSENYTKIPTYYIKFEVKESGNSKAEIGELFAAKEKFSLNVMGIKQMYDGKSLFTVSEDDKEVTVSQPEPGSDDMLTPTKVLNMYQNGYQSSLDKNVKNIQYIKLIPLQKSEVKSVLVGINKDNSTIAEYKETFNDGNSRTITVKEYLENLIIPRTLFKFDRSKYEKDGYIVTQI